MIKIWSDWLTRRKREKAERQFGGVDGSGLPLDLHKPGAVSRCICAQSHLPPGPAHHYTCPSYSTDRVPVLMNDQAQARAPHNPLQTLMPEGMTATELVAFATSVPELVKAVGTIAARFEQFVGNVHALNVGLQEFKRDVVQPLREELHHIRYNTGDRLTQTCNDIDGYVSKLDQVLWATMRAAGKSDEEIRRFKDDHGMRPDAPRGPELALHAQEFEELRASNETLIKQNRRLLAQASGHVFGGTYDWEFHQGCTCGPCREVTIALEEAKR